MRISLREVLLLSAAAAAVLAGCGGKALEPKVARPLPKLPEGAGPMDPGPPGELTSTGSGLYYRILREGKGHKPRKLNSVFAHYRGWLDSGEEFDSSYKDNGNPIEFRLDSVIRGWTEGLQLVGEGGMIELEIPPELGYGAGGMGGIPPNATLHFIVEPKKVR